MWGTVSFPAPNLPVAPEAFGTTFELLAVTCLVWNDPACHLCHLSGACVLSLAHCPPAAWSSSVSLKHANPFPSPGPFHTGSPLCLEGSPSLPPSIGSPFLTFRFQVREAFLSPPLPMESLCPTPLSRTSVILLIFLGVLFQFVTIVFICLLALLFALCLPS